MQDQINKRKFLVVRLKEEIARVEKEIRDLEYQYMIDTLEATFGK